MHVWACFIDHIPHVVSRVFIDDAYLWVQITHISCLRTAVQTTEVWGTLFGQKLNPAKSVLWATSAMARKEAKLLFPELPLQLAFDVLGAKMYTSDRDAFLFDMTKCAKIVADIRNIANLPVPRTLKEQLVGAKVIPQLSFASHISKIPKRILDKLQGELAQLLWANRPHWRSKMLVFAFLSKPHRVEPICARAYCCILDFWRFIHAHPDRFDQCRALACNPTIPKHSLIVQVRHALALFRLGLNENLDLTFASVLIPILHVGVKDIKCLLANLAVQYCYEKAALQSRKDLCKPTGLVDLSFYKSFFLMYTKPFNACFDLTPHFESQTVGCTITNDRRCAAGYCESSACRLCSAPGECLRHLLCDCTGTLPFAQPPSHEFGPNFQLLGIFEHPLGIAAHRLCYSHTDHHVQSSFDPLLQVENFWTDGSVLFGHSFWLMSAGFSIVREDGSCRLSGPVHFLNISSYAAELYAILQTIELSTSCICIATDCQTIVRQFNWLLEHQCISTKWSHQFWWRRILKCIVSRQEFTSSPVSLRWIPSHVGDHLSENEITDDFAFSHGTTRKDILLNRAADKFAKEAAESIAPIEPSLFPCVQQAVFQRQLFLARINRFIGDIPDHVSDAPPLELEHEDRWTHLKKRFPRWNWTPTASDFTWTSTKRLHEPTGWLSNLDPRDLSTFFDFTNSLEWAIRDDACTAYIEFAFLFWKRGYILHSCASDSKTFRDLNFWLRRVLVFINKIPGHGIFPGVTDQYRLKTEGRALPQGSIVGANLRFSVDELADFAELLVGGCSKHLSTWEFPL